ncbi:MAG: fluoride efflux transporter CrcB [Patulibacter minatonensis]
MSLGLALLVGVAGGLGSLLRVLVGRAATRVMRGPLAAGTFVVNVSGAFGLGLLTGLAPSTDATLVLGTGLMGGYTTFSTWMYESQRFARGGAPVTAAVNVVASLVAGLGAVWLGRVVGG